MENIRGLEELTPDLLEQSGVSLSPLANDSVNYYIDGTRFREQHLLFRIQQGFRNHQQRMNAHLNMESIADWINEQVIEGTYPFIDRHRSIQQIKTEGTPYLMSCDERNAVYCLSLTVSTLER